MCTFFCREVSWREIVVRVTDLNVEEPSVSGISFFSGGIKLDFQWSGKRLWKSVCGKQAKAQCRSLHMANVHVHLIISLKATILEFEVYNGTEGCLQQGLYGVENVFQRDYLRRPVNVVETMKVLQRFPSQVPQFVAA